MPTVLFESLLGVHYGQAYIAPEASPGFGLKDAFLGQNNGLCGGAVRECLFLITGLQTDLVQFGVELHERHPAELDDWGDIVEVPFAVSGPVNIKEWAHEAVYRLELPEGKYRARYAANEMDAGHIDNSCDKGPDSYLLQFWPDAAQTPDAIIKQTSRYAEYWHSVVRKWKD